MMRTTRPRASPGKEFLGREGGFTTASAISEARIPSLSATVAERLIQWYRKAQRPLPWRNTTDPYAIWISEIMLQQTQASTVIPYWQRWMEKVPDLHSLARLSLDQGLKLWEGLGYYRRLRHLLKAARVIEQEHNGRFPSVFHDVLNLPGVGRYTAGAICSIAFNQPAPIVDGNVARVLARVLALDRPLVQKDVQRALWAAAQSIVEEAEKQTGQGRRQCATVNQSLMELGALICLPKSPRCEICPLRSVCQALRLGQTASIPRPKERPASVNQAGIVLVAMRKGKIWLEQRGEAEVNGGFWQLPCSVPGKPSGTVRAQRAAARLALVFGIESVVEIGEVQHTIMNRRITLKAYLGTVSPKAEEVKSRRGGWFGPSELVRLPVQTSHRKILALALGTSTKRGKKPYPPP